MNQWPYMNHWQYERPMLGQLGPNPIFYGDGFSLGFNVAFDLFGPNAEDIAPNLTSRGLVYEAGSAQIAGVAHPYVSFVGRSAGSWSTASAFRDVLLQAVGEMGFTVDYGSVQYQIMPRPRTGSAQPTPAPSPRPAPRPSTSTPTPSTSTSSEEGGEWVGAVEPLPASFYETPPSQLPPSPPGQQKGINTTWLLLGFGLLAVVLASRD